MARLTDGSLVGAADKVAAIMAETAAELQNTEAQTDENYIAYLLDILQYGPDTSYAYAIEPFLDGPRDFLATQALLVLCNSYKLTEYYLNHLVKFIRGVEWDAFDDLLDTALMTAGHYLREHRNAELLCELIRTVHYPLQYSDRPNYPSLAQERQEFAYTAILEALGRPRPITRVISFQKIDPAVMREAEERLQTEESGC